MSEQRRVVSVEETAETPKTFLQKLLDGVERVGNKVPHPAVIFFILSGLVIVLSHLFYLLGTSVDYEVVNPQTHQIEHTTATVNSLLSGDGIRFMLTSMVRNFVNFSPVGIILVVMVGVGLAEQARLMTALIKKIVRVTPRKAATWILVTLGVLPSIASDAGYPVLIPLGHHAADALFRADRRRRSALRQGGRGRHGGGDDTALCGGGLGRVDPAISRLGSVRAPVRAWVTEVPCFGCPLACGGRGG